MKKALVAQIRELLERNRGTYFTLHQIAALTNPAFPLESVGARLRDLRRPQHGGYVINKRLNALGQYEYALLRQEAKLELAPRQVLVDRLVRKSPASARRLVLLLAESVPHERLQAICDQECPQNDLFTR